MFEPRNSGDVKLRNARQWQNPRNWTLELTSSQFLSKLKNGQENVRSQTDTRSVRHLRFPRKLSNLKTKEAPQVQVGGA